MKMSKCKNLFTFLLAALCFAACTNSNEKMSKCANDTWDKVFPLSEKVNHQKVSFQTQYGFTLVADLYTPKGMTPALEGRAGEGLFPALAVSGPFGATKEQSSGLYAMKMAERGFIALALILPSQVRVRVNRVARRHLISIRKISWQRWIF